MHKWNLFLRTCKTIVIVTLIGIVATGVGIHLLPNLVKTLQKVDFNDISDIVHQSQEIKSEINEIGNTIVSGVAMTTLVSNFEDSKQNHNNNNELIKGIKLTLTNIIKKMAEYDLLLEMYRTNIIIIKKLIEGLKSNQTMDEDTEHIIETLYNITINDYKNIIKALYKCFFLTVEIDDKKMNELLNGDNPNDNQFNMDISSDKYDKIHFKKIYSYMTRTEHRNTNTSYSILYSLITRFEDFEESLVPLFVRLNSCVTRLNLLFKLSKCPTDLDIKVNNIKPIFGSFMNQLIVKITDKQSSSNNKNSATITDKVTKELLKENSGVVMSEADIRKSLLTIKRELCDIKGAEAKDNKNPNIGKYSICSEKINKDGSQVTINDWEIEDIYNIILNDKEINSKLKEFIKRTQYDLCKSATGKGKELCHENKNAYFQALMIYIKDNLAEVNNSNLGIMTFDSLGQSQSGGRRKTNSKRKKTNKKSKRKGSKNTFQKNVGKSSKYNKKQKTNKSRKTIKNI